MKNKSFFIVVSCWLVINSSCGKKMGEAEYVKWMDNPKHGFVKEKEFENYVFKVQYRTPEYMYARQKNALGVNYQEFKSACTNQLSFCMNISEKGSKKEFVESGVDDYGAYIEKIDYYNNYIMNDVYVEINGNKYPCVHSLMERSYGLGPGNNILFTFEHQEKKIEKVNFVYKDQYLQTGKMNFKFTIDNAVPSLNI